MSTLEDHMEVALGLDLDSNQDLIIADDGTLILNVTAFLGFQNQELRVALGETLKIATQLAVGSGRELGSNISFQRVSDDYNAALENPKIDVEFIDSLRLVLAGCNFCTKSLRGPRRRHVHMSYKSRLPKLKPHNWKMVLRYGIVELRVLENYLFSQDALKEALDLVLRITDSDSEMYARSKATDSLTPDDMQFNIRRLMTNAGFYIGSDRSAAWPTLVDWAERYLRALQASELFTCPEASPLYFKVAWENWQKLRRKPAQVWSPNTFDFYDNIAGGDVLFVSPLSHLVNEQVASGRLLHLFKNYTPPDFSLRAIPAWISTWPNRPHGDWQETFERLCEEIDATYKERPFDTFIASCGAYGLPICDYVYTAYGTKVLYLGNRANFLFGVNQKATRASTELINPEMWLDSDLGKFANMARIDDGRYT